MNEDIILNDRPLLLNMYKSQCARCKLYNENEAICKAFPKGIPVNMLEGEITHEKPMKGQQGDYTFTPED